MPPPQRRRFSAARAARIASNSMGGFVSQELCRRVDRLRGDVPLDQVRCGRGGLVRAGQGTEPASRRPADELLASHRGLHRLLRHLPPPLTQVGAHQR
jgi:hypothetical protein